MNRSERPTDAERCAAMTEKGWLDSQEIYEWPRPYNAYVPQSVIADWPGLRWGKSTQYHLDGRIKYRRRWVGRWWVSMDTRMRAFGGRFGDEKAWRIRPDRAFDPVYLLTLQRKMEGFRAEILDSRYNEAAAALVATGRRGRIPCKPSWSEDGQTLYFSTVNVPSKHDRPGLSYGSSSIKYEATHDLARLGEVNKLRKEERRMLRNKTSRLAAKCDDAFGRNMGFGRKQGLVKELLYNAIVRHLPRRGYDPYEHLLRGACRVRILDTTFFFKLMEKEGWSNTLTLRDDTTFEKDLVFGVTR